MEYNYDWCARLAIINSKDCEKLFNDCHAIKNDLELNKYSILGIILDNKYKRDSQALRLIKKYSTENKLSICIKTACDIAIYEGSGRQRTVDFCDRVIKNIE